MPRSRPSWPSARHGRARPRGSPTNGWRCDDGAGVGSTAWAALVGASKTCKATSRDAVLAWTALSDRRRGPRASQPRAIATRRSSPRIDPDRCGRGGRDPDRRTAGDSRGGARLALEARGAPWRAAVDADLAGPHGRRPAPIAADGVADRGGPKAAPAPPASVPRGRSPCSPISPRSTRVGAVVAVAVLADRAPGAPPTRPRHCSRPAPSDAAVHGAVDAAPSTASRRASASEAIRSLIVDARAWRPRAGGRPRDAPGPHGTRRPVPRPARGLARDGLARRRLPRGPARGALSHRVPCAEGRRLAPDRVARFAPTLRGWSEDPDDPSAAGLLAGLLDLGAGRGARAGPRALEGRRRLRRGARVGRGSDRSSDAAGWTRSSPPVDADAAAGRAGRGAGTQPFRFTARDRRDRRSRPSA